MSDITTPSGIPAGWYTEPATGQARWWDGSRWGAYQAAVQLPPAQPVAVQPSSAAAPQGWYPDPQNRLIQRWWDGYRWTEQVHPMPSGSLYDSSKDAAAGKNSAATQSLVSGIIAIVFGLMPGLVPLVVAFTGASAAIIWGGIGLSRAKYVGVGRGLAVAGLVLGIIVAVLAFIGFVAIYGGL